MIRYLFIAVLVLHGLIHFLGAAKGLQWAEVAALHAPMSKVRGLIWLLAGLLVIGTAVAYAIRSPQWLWLGLAALLLSQILIAAYWQDARYGSIPNLLLVLALVGGFLKQSFDRESQVLVTQMEQSTAQDGMHYHRVADLPSALQAWLQVSSEDQLEPPTRARLTQALQLKLRREQEDWYQGRAEQFVHFPSSGFIWLLDLRLPGGIHASGRDRLGDGAGHMEVRLGGAIPLVSAHGGDALSEGSLQRYLGELVWFPPAMRDARIEWKAIDQKSVHARLEAHGQVAEGVFTFDETGRFHTFTCERFFGAGAEAKKYPWVVEALEYDTLNGWMLPVRCQATWKFDDSEWTWAEIEVVELEVFGAK